jgi:hypothetical protein
MVFSKSNVESIISAKIYKLFYLQKNSRAKICQYRVWSVSLLKYMLKTGENHVNPFPVTGGKKVSIFARVPYLTDGLYNDTFVSLQNVKDRNGVCKNPHYAYTRQICFNFFYFER